MTLVFLHPIGLDAGCWHLMDAALRESALLYTLPWHGDRPQPDEVSIPAFADDLAARTSGLLDLVGVSMGGAVAQHFALRHPDRVGSVMLACSSAGGRSRTPLLERAEATLRKGMAGMLEETLPRWFTPEALAKDDPEIVGYARQRLLADDPASFAACWRALAAHETMDRLSEIRAPATVLHADADHGASVEYHRAMAERLPLGRFGTIAGPHMVQLENPAGFSAAVHEHLRWSREARPSSLS